MPSTRPATLLVVAALASTPVIAAEPSADVGRDELMVVTRNVMPRIAYHALEPTANPVRVQATVFPGRIFHGVMHGLVGRLAGDEELGDSVPVVATGPTPGLEPGMVGPLGHGPAAHAQAGGQGGRAMGASIGGSVIRATSGIGDRVSQTILRATGQGAGP